LTYSSNSNHEIDKINSIRFDSNQIKSNHIRSDQIKSGRIRSDHVRSIRLLLSIRMLSIKDPLNLDSAIGT
jgi:hypothetical protein